MSTCPIPPALDAARIPQAGLSTKIIVSLYSG